MYKIYKYNKKESFFLIAYFLLGFTRVVIGNSYLFGTKRFVICEVVQYIAAGVFILSFCVGKYKIKEWSIRFLITAIAFLVAKQSHSIDFGLSALAVITSIDVAPKKIVKNCVRNNIFFAAIVVIPALLGLIPNDVYVRNGITAKCYGFAYYSNFPFLVFSIILALYFLTDTRKKERTVLVISFPIQLLIYKLCTVRLTLYLYFIFLFVAITMSLYNTKKSHRVLTIIATFMFPMMATFTIIISLLYTKSNLLSKINVLLNYRLGFNAIGILKYGISLFGTKIERVAESWDYNFTNHYFYIDSGYVNSLLSYGIIFYVILIVSYAFLLRYAVKNNKIKLVVWCLIICIYSIINDWLFNVALNPLPILAFNLMWNSQKVKWNENYERI